MKKYIDIPADDKMDLKTRGLDINHKNHLVLSGCDLVDLARDYGTPLYIIDEDKLRSNYHRFFSAFNKYYSKAEIFYSYKTNCIPAVLKILHQEGCGAEVVSPYEYWLAHRLQIEPSMIIYNGVNKSKEDLKAAVQQGVGLINLDSLNEIRQLRTVSDELGKRVNAGVRIYPESGWKSQFGLQKSGDNIISAFREIAESEFLDPCCLHVHFGTGIRDTRPYGNVIKKITSLLKDLKEKINLEPRYLDLGGGFGVPTVKTLSIPEMALYKIFNIPPQEPAVGTCPSIEGFAEKIAGYLNSSFERHGLEKPILLLEPGRVLTGDAQILLVTVGEIKKRNDGPNYAIADGGMQNVAFPLSYEYHKCFLANRAGSAVTDRYHVTGPLCSPEDLLFRNRELPELKRGDVLSIMDAGAYFTSFSNNFSYPRPAAVSVRNGSHKIIRDRENFKHMTDLDRI